MDNDEVYYVLDGEGEVTSNGKSQRIGPGVAAYLYRGASVGIKQLGDKPLTLIIAYPLVKLPGPPAARPADAPKARGSRTNPSTSHPRPERSGELRIFLRCSRQGLSRESRR